MAAGREEGSTYSRGRRRGREEEEREEEEERGEKGGNGFPANLFKVTFMSVEVE